MSRIKIICTLGPSSFDRKILNELKKEGIDIFRINLSHTDFNQIEKKIIYLKKNKVKNICIDTEGAQIRTTHTIKKYYLKKGKTLYLDNSDKNSSNKIINLYPEVDLTLLSINTKIFIGFNSLCLKVIEKKKFGHHTKIKCKVIESGFLESKKGVHIDKNMKLSPLTKKDLFALKIAKKHKIKHFAVSFVNHPKDLDQIINIVGNKVNIISKIETKNAIKYLKDISKISNALLVDRGDLSRYIPIETIPLAQEYILQHSVKFKTPTYVATNLLETMISSSEPTRAESHDIYSSLKQGAKGLVLAAETAIGNNPIKCVKFLKKCINKYKLSKISKFKI